MYSKSQVSESSNYQLLMHRWQVMTFFWLRQPVVEKAFVTSYPPWYRKVLYSKEGLVGNLSHLFVNWIRDNIGYHSAGFSYGWSTGIVGSFKHQSIAIECQFYQIWSRWNTGSKWIHATLRWVIQYFWFLIFELGNGRQSVWPETALRYTWKIGQEQEVHVSIAENVPIETLDPHCHRRSPLLLSIRPWFQTRSGLYIRILVLELQSIRLNWLRPSNHETNWS